MSWEPVRADHSIDRATASLTLRDRLDPNAFDELVVAARKAAAACNLTNRVDLPDAIELPATAQGVIQIGPGELAPPRRVVFQRLEAGTNAAVDEISIGAKRIAFGTLRYQRWTDFNQLLERVLSALDDVHPITANAQFVQVQYLDRFESSQGDADHFEVINRSSRFMTEAVQDATAAFHVHSGWFEFESESVRKLTNVNIDASEAVSNTLPNARRSISVLSLGQFEALAGTLDRSVERLGTLHEYLKNTFRSTITPQMAARVGLND